MLVRSSINNNNVINKSARNAISVFECSAFSLDVYYSANDPKRPPMPPGWKEFAEAGISNSGYFGRCYIKNFDKPTGPYLVVFAHRGTVVDSFISLLNALDVALGNVPAQIDLAARFVTTVEMALTKKYENIDWSNSFGIQTGHSMGGVIADLLSVGSLGMMPSITFENPGSKPIIFKYLKQHGLSQSESQHMLLRYGDACETYLADVNLINTCNEQVGKSWRMIDLPYLYGEGTEGPMLNIPSDYRINFYYWRYTSRQHQMENIYPYFENRGAIEKVNYPVGFKPGYGAYLDGVARKDYWDGYLAKIWASDANLREDFQDIENYAPVFYLALKQIYDNVLGKSLKVKTDVSPANLGLFAPPLKNDGLSIDDFVLIENDDSDEAIDETFNKCVVM